MILRAVYVALAAYALAVVAFVLLVWLGAEALEPVDLGD